MLQSFPLVRLAALDLDGTLLNRNNEVTLATRQAIARAVEHGVVVVPATGRPLASLPPHGALPVHLASAGRSRYDG